MPEISHHCQKTPFLLVGTQIDLRDDAAIIEKLAKNKQKPLSLEMGEKLAKELRAVKYVECSALTQVNLELNYSSLLLQILSNIVVRKAASSQAKSYSFRVYFRTLLFTTE